MKAYTDIEQSKKLAEMLPLESADMCWTPFDEKWDAYLGSPNPDAIKKEIPCWSLAALLNILPYPSLLKTFSGWRCDSYNKEGNTCMLGESADNQIDACYEMIIKLHEQKIL